MTALNNEYHVYGPPGTGKTTWLKKQIEATCEQYFPEQILVVSFTRTAAKEIVQRGLPIPEENVGTLHAMCFRIFERPKIAETQVKDFNTKHPEYAIPAKGAAAIEGDDNSMLDGAGHGNILSELQMLRAQLIPKEKWPAHIQEFQRRWQQWKELNFLYDFSDLIEEAIWQCKEPPEGIKVAFVDEAQDFTALEFALLREWAKHLDWIVMVGDDDQSIYGFKGSDPKAFVGSDIPDDNRTVLDKSYRLPSNILHYSRAWVEQIQDRIDKDFLPANEGGRVETGGPSFKQPDQIVDEVLSDLERKDYDSVMVLGSCSYMIDPIKHELRDRGILFHNPFRRTRGDWNPLVRKEKQHSAISRLENFLYSYKVSPYNNEEIDAWREQTKAHLGYRTDEPLWHPDEFRVFMHVVNATKSMKRGAKKLLPSITLPQGENADPRVDVVRQFLIKQAKPEFLDALFMDFQDGTPSRFWEFVASSKASSFEYIKRIIETHGIFDVFMEPRVIIGTIHSVKGGEADAVYLFPDISPESNRNKTNDSALEDDIFRSMYVGMTRAKKKVVLCNPTSHSSVRWLPEDSISSN